MPTKRDSNVQISVDRLQTGCFLSRSQSIDVKGKHIKIKKRRGSAFVSGHVHSLK